MMRIQINKDKEILMHSNQDLSKKLQEYESINK